MKNTIRASHKNGNKSASTQTKTPPTPGQAAAPIGHSLTDQLASVLGFTPQQMEAFAKVAESQKESVASYLRAGALFVLQTGMDELQTVAISNLTKGDKDAQILLATTKLAFRDCDDVMIGEDDFATVRRSKEINRTDSPRIIPLTLVDDANSALNELHHAGGAASSLLMMVADNLRENMGAYAPSDKSGAWEQFSEFEFLAAPLDLAINQISKFRTQFDLWRKREHSMIEGTIEPSQEHLEVEILQLNALLIFQANAFDTQYKGIGSGTSPMLLAQSVTACLWSAYEKSLRCHSTLFRAIERTKPVNQAA
jgi:hypothetical protein